MVSIHEIGYKPFAHLQSRYKFPLKLCNRKVVTLKARRENSALSSCTAINL